jgi:hypothetical protein
MNVDTTTILPGVRLIIGFYVIQTAVLILIVAVLIRVQKIGKGGQIWVVMDVMDLMDILEILRRNPIAAVYQGLGTSFV